VPGSRLTYTVSLRSQGQVSGTARLSDTLPTELTYVTGSLWASSGTYTYSNGMVTWSGDVFPIQPVTLTFEVTLTSPLPDGHAVANTALIDDGLETLQRSVTIWADSAPPSSQATSPAYSQAPITVTFVASDTLSGIALTRLWARYEDGLWADTALALPGESGAFTFTPAQGEGRYSFASQALDQAGWWEEQPQGEGDCSTIFDVTAPSSEAAAPLYAGAPFSVTFVASDTLSGIALTHLWARYQDGSWADTGLALPGETGAFHFTPTQGEGRYHFASQALDQAGWWEEEPQGEGDASTVWDTQAPSSTAFSPASSPVPTFTVSWAGDDGPLGSGVVGYRLEVRPDGGGSTWTVWISDTVALSDTFVGTAGRTYCFRSSARDCAGNVEAPPGEPRPLKCPCAFVVSNCVFRATAATKIGAWPSHHRRAERESGEAMAEPSAEVVRQAQAGDEAALTELVLSQQNYIYSIAMGIFRHPEDAEEITQEVFIRLFRVLPTFRGDTRFTTWLYRVVVNLCYDDLRQRKRRPLPTENGEEALGRIQDTASWSDPEREALQAETQDRVRAALQQIGEPYSLALILYYFHGLKYREIAEVTGWPLNTVKSHIRRGKMQMAELLTDQERDVSSPLWASEHHSERQPAAPSPVARMVG